MFDIHPMTTINTISNEAKTKIYINIYRICKNEQKRVIQLHPYELYKLGFDRKTIYKALKELEEFGVLRIEKVKGSYYRKITLLK